MEEFDQTTYDDICFALQEALHEQPQESALQALLTTTVGWADDQDILDRVVADLSRVLNDGRRKPGLHAVSGSVNLQEAAGKKPDD